MKTIVEPKGYIDKLWGKQGVQDGETYRMMRYVMRVDHDDKVLLQNVVTGQLVVLEPEEMKAIDGLPKTCEAGMEQLISQHYLVRDDFDEHEYVRSMRRILRSFADAHRTKAIMHYTILPTTACNARCYYCFEQGIKPVSMTEETAEDVIKFIDKNCGDGRAISFTWFGGEPTVATNRIDQICKGVSDRKIHYSSQMITNGYLLDQSMVDRARSLWKLSSVQITVDGTEASYNKIKAYVNAVESPYQRVMNNIRLLLNKGIKVNLRMNFDKNNYAEFRDLIQEISDRFGDSENINVRAHPIHGEYVNCDGILFHADDDWFSQKVVELNDIADAAGLFVRKKELPSLHFLGCLASSDSSVTITPDGHLVNCPEHVDEEQYIGNVKEGIINTSVSESWKEFCDYEKCSKCNLFPFCSRIKKCSAKDRCNFLGIYVQQLTNAMIERYQIFNKRMEDVL